MTVVFALEAAFSKHSQVACFSAPLQLQVKDKRPFWSNFSKVFERKSFNAIIAIKHAFLGENDMVACFSIPDQFLKQILFSPLAKIVSGRKKKKKRIIEICKARLPVLVNPASRIPVFNYSAGSSTPLHSCLPCKNYHIIKTQMLWLIDKYFHI